MNFLEACPEHVQVMLHPKPNKEVREKERLYFVISKITRSSQVLRNKVSMFESLNKSS